MNGMAERTCKRRLASRASVSPTKDSGQHIAQPFSQVLTNTAKQPLNAANGSLGARGADTSWPSNPRHPSLPILFLQEGWLSYTHS